MPDAVAVAILGRAFHTAGHADHDAAGRDDSIFGDDRAHADNAAGTDVRPIHDHGPHPDQDIVFHDGPVNDGRVSDRNAVAQRAGHAGIGVQHAQVLDVALPADTNRFAITSNDRVEPNAGLGGDPHIADDPRAGGDKGGVVDQFGTKDKGIRHGNDSPDKPRAFAGARHGHRLAARATTS
jgi:hypothetical protein